MFLNQVVSILRRPLKPCNHARTDLITVKSFATNIVSRELFREQKFCPVDFTKSTHRYIVPKELWQSLVLELNERLALLGEILAKQCNFYVAHRLRRANQIWNLYSRLYAEKTLIRLVSKFVERLKNKPPKSLGLLLSAAVFKWEQERISDNEMKRCIDEFEILSQKCGNNNNHNGHCSEPTLHPEAFKAHLAQEGWEPVVENSKMFLWRRWKPDTSGYEYKVFGTFYDIPARAFFSVQTDTEYRKRWDNLVIKLDIIDKEAKGGCEIVHWVMHYPFPMYKRDYVYIRRALVDGERNVMVLMSRSTNHPACPPVDKCVRITKYTSHMVIRPHHGIDEDGFDFLLSYYDDPESSFPGPIYSWMAASGVPDFLEKLHGAARNLHHKSKASTPASTGAHMQCAAYA